MTEKEVKKALKSLDFIKGFLLEDKWLNRASDSSVEVSDALEKIYTYISVVGWLILRSGD